MTADESEKKHKNRSADAMKSEREKSYETRGNMLWIFFFLLFKVIPKANAVF